MFSALPSQPGENRGERLGKFESRSDLFLCCISILSSNCKSAVICQPNFPFSLYTPIPVPCSPTPHPCSPYTPIPIPLASIPLPCSVYTHSPYPSLQFLCPFPVAPVLLYPSLQPLYPFPVGSIPLPCNPYTPLPLPCLLKKCAAHISLTSLETFKLAS